MTAKEVLVTKCRTLVILATVRCVYDVDHMHALWIENTHESDPHSHEPTKAVVKNAPQNYEASTGFKPMTSAIPV